jgi:electron transport complex protein RnfC
LVATSFKGGVHPEEAKDQTSGIPISDIVPPDIVVIPLSQHTGAPSKPVVEAGDEVRIGTKIGEADGFISVPVHSSVSGKVIGIESRPHPLGRRMPAVVIENDGRDEWVDLSGHKDLTEESPQKIREAVREAGLVGLGGAAFPTHVKISPPDGKPIDTAILNGAECEPVLTSDHRVMLEYAGEVIQGLKIIMRVVGAERGFIGIERNKPDAIRLMSEMVAGEDGIEVVALKVKYPQGAEKQLIKALTGREVPCGGLPMDVGCLVQNVGTSLGIYEAARYGRPLVSRVVTLAGSVVKTPGNYRVRIGTQFGHVVSSSGGTTGPLAKMIMGGPMMGIAQADGDAPVVKGTSGLILLAEDEVTEPDPSACIRCGRCVDHCPMNLVPNEIVRFVEKGKLERAEQYGIMDCMECGVCAYICPSKIGHVQLMKLGKAALWAAKRKAEQEA